MLKKIIALALVGTALGENCATFAELTASNFEEYEIKYSMEKKEMTSTDGKKLGFEQVKQVNGKIEDYAVLGDYSENHTFKVKGDKNKQGFRIWSTDEKQIFSYNQGSYMISALSIKGGYYMWKVAETDSLNSDYSTAEDYFTQFTFDDKTQSLKKNLKIPLAIKEGKRGTQIYQNIGLLNGMNGTDTRFCFVAQKKRKNSNNGQGTGSQHDIQGQHTKTIGGEKDDKQKTGEGNDDKQVTDKNDKDGQKSDELGHDDPSSSASVGVLVALITLTIITY